jgi:hypothetical protein
MCLVAPEDKSDSPITCASTTKVPDRDGVRFCRVCQAFKPVSIFPAGIRRFVCRTHFWERQGKLRKLVLFTNPSKRAVICLWKRLYEDSRTLGPSLALTQAEVAEMLETEANDHRLVEPFRCRSNALRSCCAYLEGKCSIRPHEAARRQRRGGLGKCLSLRDLDELWPWCTLGMSEG